MEKILVTTDFSTNSKAGIRFAIQLASQHKYELTFFHTYYLVLPTSMSHIDRENIYKDESKKIQKKLNQFVASIYKSRGVPFKSLNCIIQSSVSADTCIMDYARENKFGFICMSTRGSSSLIKILGTTTSNLIKHSEVPVIAIPHKYRTNEINSVTYASDLEDLKNEVTQVVAFAKSLKAKLTLLHFHYLTTSDFDSKSVETTIKKHTNYKISALIKKADPAETIISNLEVEVRKSKPSILIMFSRQKRSFLDKIFLSSKTAEYSFRINVPLLVFGKK